MLEQLWHVTKASQKNERKKERKKTSMYVVPAAVLPSPRQKNVPDVFTPGATVIDPLAAAALYSNTPIKYFYI